MSEGRRPVTLHLNERLVDAAVEQESDLSRTVDRLLQRHVRPEMTDEEVKLYVAAARMYQEQHGLAGEDYLPV